MIVMFYCTIPSIHNLLLGIFRSHTSVGFSPKDQAGTLYALKSDKTLSGLTSGITLTNGLTWNEKINKFYYIDTFAGEVYEFDSQDSQICTFKIHKYERRYVHTIFLLANKKVIFNFRESGVEGGPDGMTIDTDGNLWVACFGGARIIKIDPTKPNTVLQTINMPVSQVWRIDHSNNKI